MRIQLWSYNYDPEPTGIGPVSRVLAAGLRDRGHEVDVVAAHPHYPEPKWGVRRLPYREVRDGIPVLRLPLWVGRASAAERYRQELTYMASQFAALPVLGRPDVLVSVSPCFPALLPGIVNVRLRRLPWLLWLQDILPDGAAAVGLVRAGVVMSLARRLERTAYAQAHRITVPSQVFAQNLVGKGVSADRIAVLHNPATRTPGRSDGSSNGERPDGLRILAMGNIGHSQGLGPLAEAFERSPALAGHNVRLVIAGHGVAADEVRRVASGRIEMIGLVDDSRLESELQRADVGLVSQRYGGAEFNIPSKLMNFMTYGLPCLAAVNPDGEVARIVKEARCGWIVNSTRAEQLPEKIAELSVRREEIAERGDAAAEYARRHFSAARYVEQFEVPLREAIGAWTG